MISPKTAHQRVLVGDCVEVMRGMEPALYCGRCRERRPRSEWRLVTPNDDGAGIIGGTRVLMAARLWRHATNASGHPCNFFAVVLRRK